MSGGGGGSTTTVQKADPWIGVQPALKQLYSGAIQNYQSGGPQYFPGNVTAPQSPWTQMGLNSQAARGAAGANSMAGTNLTDTAQNAATATLNNSFLGKNNPYSQGLSSIANRGVSQMPGFGTLTRISEGGMLNSNPYLDKMFGAASRSVQDAMRNSVLPGINSQFELGGRYGSNQQGTAQNSAVGNFGDTLNNLATQIYGGNYANERGLQQQALGQLGALDQTNQLSRLSAYNQLQDAFGRERAVQLGTMGQANPLANQDYADISQLGMAGGMQDQRAQTLINDEINKWNFNQNLPTQNLQTLSGLLNGFQTLNGSTSRSSNNPGMLQNALGLGGLGLMANSAMGGSLFGAGAAGGAGLLFDGLAPGLAAGGTEVASLLPLLLAA